MRRANFLIASILSFVWLTDAASAENGVTSDKIVLGQVAALAGPAAALGQGMRDGLLAAFGEVNAKGGIMGRKIELLSIDDGYEPNKAIIVARQLIEETKVFALVGSVGTPTSAAIEPIATSAGVPFIGAFTGAEFLSDPFRPSVINVRASYFQETETMVEHLTKDLGVSRIAIFYQDDAFGQAGLAGVKRALDSRQMTLVGEGTFERNTIAVKRALLSIKNAKPEAVIMIAPYNPAAEFIKVASQAGLSATFVNISFVGSDALAKELGAAGAGVVVTQVVPFPQDRAIQVVRQYQDALKSATPDAAPEFVSLEGYLVGRLTVMALEKIPSEPTRQALVNSVTNNSKFDLGGVTLTYRDGKNRGSDQVFLTVIGPDGRFQAVDRLSRQGHGAAPLAKAEANAQ